MSDRVTVVSVDLDDVDCYAAIHGLGPVDPESHGVALHTWLPRTLEFFDRMGVRATFFVIGKDVQRDLDGPGRGAGILAQAARDGHELGNHSYAHAYDFVAHPEAAMRQDIMQCDRVLRGLGVVPMGFRAPGYTHDQKCLEVVASCGYRYDTSRLPSPPYYLAKLAMMGWGRLRGRRSASTLRGWRSFGGRTTPHVVASTGLWEFPVSVSPALRLPLIGTSLLAAPSRIFDRLCTTIESQPYFHLELHAIDFADPDRDPLPVGLLSRQPGLRADLAHRLGRLERLLGLRPAGAPVCSLLPQP